MTQQEKIDSIRTDFLDRSNVNFVRIRRTGRIGWEAMIPEGGNYSDVFRNHDAQDIIKESYRLAKDYIIAMDTPYRVELCLSNEENYTDSKRVVLATKVFDDSDLSEGQKVDTFIGLAIHEACHLKYTDFTIKASSANEIIARLINIIEDERIERACGEDTPGFANYLQSTKYYYFDKYCQDTAALRSGLSDDIRLMNAILSMVRYPKVIEEKALTDFTDELYEVHEILKSFPTKSSEVMPMAVKIYDVLRAYFERQERKKDEQEQEQSDGQKQGSGQNGGQSGEASGRTEAQIQDAVEKDLKELGRKLAGAMNDLTQNPGDAQTRKLTEDEISEIVKNASRYNDGKLFDMICRGYAQDEPNDQCVILKTKPDNAEYRKSLDAVRHMVPAIRKTLLGHNAERRFVQQGMRSGVLDTSKLAEGFQGVQTVYKRAGVVKTDPIAVAVVIDESGSMHGNKIKAARDLAVLLDQAAGSIPGVDLYIYGHTSLDVSNGCEILAYKEGGNRSAGEVLGSIRARSSNWDAHALAKISELMDRKSGKVRKLIFAISDGKPCDGEENLTYTVKKLERQGVSVVGIGIESGLRLDKYYTHHIRFTDMNRLASELGKTIKTAIVKNSLKRTT